jgi:ornithine carbamoyltransferase
MKIFSQSLKTKYQARIEIVRDPKSAIEGATIVSTDVWASMGQEEEAERRKEVFKPYQLNSELLSLAKSNVLVLHCLPAHRDEEITEEVLEGKNSIVWLQAENKMWFHMALLEFLLL